MTPSESVGGGQSTSRRKNVSAAFLLAIAFGPAAFWVALNYFSPRPKSLANLLEPSGLMIAGAVAVLLLRRRADEPGFRAALFAVAALLFAVAYGMYLFVPMLPE